MLSAAEELLYQLHHSTSLNLTFGEGFFLLLGAAAVWSLRKRSSVLPVLYGVFLILYITLLRRPPGYDERIRLDLSFWRNAGVWAGNLLNLVLYIPFGWAAARWAGQKTADKSSKKTGARWLIIIFGAGLSLFCEVTQYVTGRGWLDVNDILFNTLGTAVGMVIGKK